MAVRERLEVQRRYRWSIYQEHEFHAGNSDLNHRQAVTGLKQNLFSADGGAGSQQDREKKCSDHGHSRQRKQYPTKTNVRAIIFFQVEYVFEMPVSTVAKLPGHEKIRAAKGARTRESILHVAVNLASLDGLQGLSIGPLADELKMSKSGLFAHFGSKEDLQLATVEMERQIVLEHLIRPTLAHPKAIPHLCSLCNSFMCAAQT